MTEEMYEIGFYARLSQLILSSSGGRKKCQSYLKLAIKWIYEPYQKQRER